MVYITRDSFKKHTQFWYIKFSVGKCQGPETRVLMLLLPLLPMTAVLHPLRIFVVTYIIQNGVTAVDMATVGDRRDIPEILSTAAEQEQATPTTVPQSSMMTSSSTAKMSADHTTA